MIIPLLLGVLLIALGCINCRGNISSIHWYNRRKVKPEDIPKYGKFMGTGSIAIGASIALMAIFDAEFIIIAGMILGLPPMLYAQFKYNHGLF